MRHPAARRQLRGVEHPGIRQWSDLLSDFRETLRYYQRDWKGRILTRLRETLQLFLARLNSRWMTQSARRTRVLSTRSQTRSTSKTARCWRRTDDVPKSKWPPLDNRRTSSKQPSCIMTPDR